MKYKTLRNRFEKLIRKQDQGKKVKPKKVAKLQGKLLEKKSDIENRLQKDLAPEKRESLKIRLGVVNAHLNKLENL